MCNMSKNTAQILKESSVHNLMESTHPRVVTFDATAFDASTSSESISRSGWIGDTAFTEILDACRPFYGFGTPPALPQSIILSPRLEDSILVANNQQPASPR